MRSARTYSQRALSVALAAALLLAVTPAFAMATVGVACDPFAGSVPAFAAAPLDGGAQLSWEASGGLVRIVRSGSAYHMESTVTVDAGVLTVSPACLNAGARVVYEGTDSAFTDSGMENGYIYFYTAFLSDGAGGWLAPSGAWVSPKTPIHLSRPKVPTRVERYLSFRVRGALGEPARWNTTVRLTFQRKVSGHYRYMKSGTYKLRAGARSYSIPCKISKAGNIKLVASHADRDHVLSKSAPRYFYSHRY